MLLFKKIVLPINRLFNAQYRNFTMASLSNNEQNLITEFHNFKLSPSKLLNLPIEENRSNYVRRFINGVIFSHVIPSPITSPQLVAFSEKALIDILDLDPVVIENQDFVDFIAGNKLIPNSATLAHRYGGHQFGVWAMQLGDGRAIILGDYINSKGERWELQLKGTGKTPYSRDGDGRAVLRSSIREFLCSEAMFYLGIPTTRAAAIVTSEDTVLRDPLYDGEIMDEHTSVVLRLAPSWFRIGSLEILAKHNEIPLLSQLTNFIIQEHFPDIPDDDNKIVNFVKKVFRLSSDLVVKWQAVGFIHGVLNTDNMSLLGLTIDYGPFAFMESYDPRYVPNISDTQGRYSYGQQVNIVLFNMLMLAKAVAPLLSSEKIQLLAETLREELKYIEDKFLETMSEKLGFTDTQKSLVEKLLFMLEETKADFPMSLRQLSETPLGQVRDPPHPELWALRTLSRHDEYLSFINSYEEKINELGISEEERMSRMMRVNPCYTMRTWMAEEAICFAEDGDLSRVSDLLEVLTKPFTRQEKADSMGYSSEPPRWARKLKLSCSS